MKLEDQDVSRESLPVREMFENLKSIINFGNIEFDVTSSSQPDFDAPEQTKVVLSLFGSQYRLYISYLGEWYYATLNKL